MVSPDVVGIGSEYFAVYFRVYIYVRLIMLGYLFFCILFNVYTKLKNVSCEYDRLNG